MLEILEVREGQFEISDKYCDEDRDRTKTFQSGTRFFVPFVMILLFFSFRIDSIILRIMAILLLIAIIGGLLYSISYLRDKLPLELSGFVVDFTPEKKVGTIRTRHWLFGSNHEFMESEIRINQAIGFSAKLDQEGDVLVEIMVDFDYPGTPIFRTYNMESLAELNHMLQEILPDLDRWIYRKWDGADWNKEMKDELNEAIQKTRVPWQIRKYFDFKVHSWN